MLLRRASASTGAGAAASSLCADSPIVNVADALRYQGLFRLFPQDGTSTRWGFSNGALTGRVVNGNIQLLIAGAAPNGDPVYEVSYPGVGPSLQGAPIAPLVHNWGDVYQGKRLVADTSGHGTTVRGLLWADDMLLWAYGDTYAPGQPHNPSIGATRLNADGTKAAYGPWRTTANSQKTRGYMVRHPSTGQVGYGAPATSGNAGSAWGATVNLGGKPDLNLPPDPVSNTAAISISTTPFIDHSMDHPQRRYDTNWKKCAWKAPYDSSQGGLTGPGDDNFDTLDMITAAAWVKTANNSGIVCFGQMVQTLPNYVYGGGDTVVHRWYGPGICPHGQDGRALQGSVGDAAGSAVLNMWVFDPNNPAVDPRPVPIRTLVPSANVASTVYELGGAWFEPSSGLLFVSQIMVDRLFSSYEPQPVIHVFQVQ
jgi:hypothetical protein